MTAWTIVAVAAAALSGLCLAASVLVLLRVRKHSGLLDREIQRGKAEFDAVVAREVAERTDELDRTLARLRAESLSQLADEERRIAEERRRDVGERERTAGARLTEQLIAAQRAVEQRLVDWAGDIEKLQAGLGDELKHLEAAHRQQMSEIESRIGKDAEGLESQLEEQRQLIARLRDELNRSAHDAATSANAELEAHAAERRRALHELADRLRKRESDLKDLIEREGAEAAQRVQVGLGDVERRQVEQLQRVVSRAATRYSEAASEQFDSAIRSAREEAARRLARELDLAVGRFAREAEGVLTERMNQASDAAASRVEERLARLRGNVERQRDEALASLEDRAHAVEAGLRDRLQEIAAEAESERVVLEARLQELGRRIEDLTARTS